jgi:hypothetical protein
MTPRSLGPHSRHRNAVPVASGTSDGRVGSEGGSQRVVATPEPS